MKRNLSFRVLSMLSLTGLFIMGLCVCFPLTAQAQKASDETDVRNLVQSLLEEVRSDKPRGAPDWPPANLAEWEAQKAYYHKRYITEVLNLPPLSKKKEWGEVPPVKYTWPYIDKPKYIILRLRYMSRPNLWVTANLYIPKGLNGKKAPAIVWAHGHTTKGKSGYQHQLCNLAQKGFVVLAVDAIGMGERVKAGHAMEGYHLSYEQIQGQWAVGNHFLGIQVWDLMRGIDFLASRNEVDIERIGTAGRSGGGTQARALAVADPRIKAAWSGDGCGSLAHLGWGCLCEWPPNVGRFADQYITIATTAPRCAFFIAGGTQDFISADADTEVYDKAKLVYELYGVPQKLGCKMWNKGHTAPQVVRERMYGWFKYWLKGEGTPTSSDSEESISATTYEQCKVGIPAESETMVHLAHEAGSALPPSPSVLDDLNQFVQFRNTVRENLKTDAFGYTQYMPEKADLQASTNGQTVFYRSQEAHGNNIIIKATFKRPNGTSKVPVIINASPEANTDFLVNAGYGVLSVNVRPLGHHTDLQAILFLGLPMEAQRIYDLLRAIDYLHTRADVDIEKIGIFANETQGANRALFVSALDERIKVSVIANGLSSYKLVSPDPYIQYTNWNNIHFYPTRILQTADIPQAAAMIAPRPLLIAEPVNTLNRDVSLTDMQSGFNLATNAYTVTGAAGNFSMRENGSQSVYLDWFNSKMGITLPDIPQQPYKEYVSQTKTDTGYYVVHGDSRNVVGQTFKTTSDCEYIDYVQMHIDSNQWHSSEPLTLTLYESKNRATILKQVTLNGSNSGNHPMFNLKTFVRPNTNYYMELSHDGGGDNSVGWVCASSSSTYSDGSAYTGNTAITAQAGDLNFRIFGHKLESYDEYVAQTTEDIGYYVVHEGSRNVVGQTFKTTADCNYIDYVQMHIDSSQWHSSETLTLTLYESKERLTMLGQVSLNGSNDGHYPRFNLNTFVLPNISYYMELTHDGGGDNTVGWVCASSSDSYSDGSAYTGDTTLTAQVGDLNFRIFGHQLESHEEPYDEYVSQTTTGTGYNAVSGANRNVVGQTFRTSSDCEYIDYVQMYIDSSSWDPSETLMLTLYTSKARSTIVKQVSLSGSNNGNTPKFNLNTFVRSNTSYYMELSHDGGGDDSIGWVCASISDSYPNGSAYTGNTTLTAHSGDLYFRIFGHKVEPYDEYVSQTTEDTGYNVLYGGKRVGQTFATTSDCTYIDYVQMHIDSSQWDSSEVLTLKLYNSKARSTTVAQASLSGSNNGDYPKFNLKTFVSPNKSYYMELSHGGGGDNTVGWVCASSSNSYYNGSAFTGTTTLTAKSGDLYFRIFGHQVEPSVKSYKEYISQTTGGTGYNLISIANLVGQTITTPSSCEYIDYVQFYIDPSKWDPSETLTLRLYDSIARSTTVAQASLSGSNNGSFPKFYLNTFVSPNTSYYMEFSHGGGADNLVGWIVASKTDSYPNGSAYTGKNSAMTKQAGDLYFRIFGHQVEAYDEYVSQTKIETGYYVVHGDSRNVVGQTFKTTSDCKYIDYVQMYIDSNQWSKTETLTLTLYDSEYRSTILGQVSLSGSNSGNYPKFYLAANVIPGTSYYMELTHDGGGDNRVGWVIATNSNSYPNGSAYTGNSTLTKRDGDLYFRIFGFQVTEDITLSATNTTDDDTDGNIAYYDVIDVESEDAILTIGSLLYISAEDLGLEEIKGKVKVHAFVDGKKIKMKIVDHLEKDVAVHGFNCVWQKKHHLYSQRRKNSYDVDSVMGSPLEDIKIESIGVVIDKKNYVVSKDVYLTPPVVTEIEGSETGENEFVVKGGYFGSKPPLVLVQCIANGDEDKIVYKRCKVVKNETLKYINAFKRENMSCMKVYEEDLDDELTGYSEVVFKYPNLSKGLEATGIIVIDNGVGYDVIDTTIE